MIYLPRFYQIVHLIKQMTEIVKITNLGCGDHMVVSMPPLGNKAASVSVLKIKLVKG